MASKPISSEAIALTEKKMDMTLDDIIKMSKTKTINSSSKQRVPNKNRRIPDGNQKAKSLKIRQYMESRSTPRQGVLAQRRSNFRGNNFPMVAEFAQRAAVAPFRNNRLVNSNRTANWNKPRPAPMKRYGNSSGGGSAFQKPQQSIKRVDIMPKQKPKTLDSLFANMKEQRMRSFTHTKNGGAGHRGVGGNKPRQPWLRGRFGNYRN